MIIRKPFHTPGILPLLGASAVIVLIILYFSISHFQHVKNPSDTTIPGITQLKDGLTKALKPGRRGEIWLYDDLKATFSKLFSGILLSVVISLVLGIMMGCFATVEGIFSPIVSLLSKLTPTAMLAVFFVIFGTGNSMFISMIVFGIVPSLTQSTFLSARKVPMEFIYKAYTLGGSTFEVIWFVVFKQILPSFINNVRLSIGPAMVYLIAAEMVVGDCGFGYRIRIQSRLLSMNVVYIYLGLLAFTGYLVDYSLIRLNRWLCAWAQQE